jgi:hypothetical protein
MTLPSQLMQFVHEQRFANTGFTLILRSLSFKRMRLISKPERNLRKYTMNALKALFSALLNRGNNAPAARQLLERASQARGLSQGDAAQLRTNALAMLSVVR